jgi:hypothetical protein
LDFGAAQAAFRADVVVEAHVEPAVGAVLGIDAHDGRGEHGVFHGRADAAIPDDAPTLAAQGRHGAAEEIEHFAGADDGIEIRAGAAGQAVAAQRGQRLLFRRHVAHRVAQDVFGIGMGEGTARRRLRGDEFDLAVDRHDPRGEAGRAAAHFQAEFRRLGLETEDVGLDFRLDAHVGAQPGHFLAQEARHVRPRHDDLPAVDFPQGFRQQLFERPEVARAEDPAAFPGHEIGRKFRAAQEGQFGVRHEQQLAVFVVEIHAEHGRNPAGVDFQLAPPSSASDRP